MVRRYHLINQSVAPWKKYFTWDTAYPPGNDMNTNPWNHIKNTSPIWKWKSTCKLLHPNIGKKMFCLNPMVQPTDCLNVRAEIYTSDVGNRRPNTEDMGNFLSHENYDIALKDIWCGSENNAEKLIITHYMKWDLVYQGRYGIGIFFWGGRYKQNPNEETWMWLKQTYRYYIPFSSSTWWVPNMGNSNGRFFIQCGYSKIRKKIVVSGKNLEVLGKNCLSESCFIICPHESRF